MNITIFHFSYVHSVFTFVHRRHYSFSFICMQLSVACCLRTIYSVTYTLLWRNIDHVLVHTHVNIPRTVGIHRMSWMWMNWLNWMKQKNAVWITFYNLYKQNGRKLMDFTEHLWHQASVCVCVCVCVLHRFLAI